MRNILIFLELKHEVDNTNQAHSAAGDQVQNEILEELNKNTEEDFNIICISHDPFSQWPKGPLFVKSKKSGNIIYPWYINFPVLKSFFFLFHYIYFTLFYKPKLILKYNTNIIDAIVFRMLRLVITYKVAIIIQDIVLPKGIRHYLKRLSNYHAVKLTRKFDVLVPITEDIAKYFNFPVEKTIVFRGGVTRQTREILKAVKTNTYGMLVERAIFAGALEPYNGIDWLIKHWIEEGVTLPLVVFGNGTLRPLLEAEHQRHQRSGGRIIYMGFCDEATVSKFISTSKINICLRFSKGIKEEYFFPSKFINMCAAPGVLLCNQFKNIPTELMAHCNIVKEGIGECIKEVIESSDKSLEYHHLKRVQWLYSNSNWGVVVKKILIISGVVNAPQE